MNAVSRGVQQVQVVALNRWWADGRVDAHVYIYILYVYYMYIYIICMYILYIHTDISTYLQLSVGKDIWGTSFGFGGVLGSQKSPRRARPPAVSARCGRFDQPIFWGPEEVSIGEDFWLPKLRIYSTMWDFNEQTVGFSQQRLGSKQPKKESFELSRKRVSTSRKREIQQHMKCFFTKTIIKNNIRWNIFLITKHWWTFPEK